MTSRLWITGDPDTDALLSDDPFALLVGMLLDQQFPMEHAFAGPGKIRERMGSFDVRAIAEADPEEFVAMATTPPAIHRYGRSMAGRVLELARTVVDEYDGDAARIWTAPGADGGAPTGREVLRRLNALPGYGERKAKIFLALLGKQRGVRPEGWREAAGEFGEEGSRRSIADVTSAEALQEVRAFKKAQKAAAKKG
ncbi:HhH-GPD-type base excision DNA repair protein [Promicromonospora citrea]|uniref:(Fe-S)-cluster assembly protein n=1 Tax=Promicromonospora citrea TaxID=43677 RepID=A0A8H9GIT6_9MICO|nr:HhH-GPD-type base excision DNA repair protein [Promicromonospora citrea]NNH51639.1 Fe-S cluster assembly protein HesB [Promicromonospora citrea]GGM22596.1 (Fe-S)-cluster assembly protein [Promicromonospora citrea]HEV6952679.1 HhH-GPD-type base excision DNA repair protein [Promicromonospora sp.]